MTTPDFDAANPPPQDLASLAWATWTFYDRTGADNLEVAQVHARLGLHARTVDGVTYHRPLAAAADYITRPDQMTKRGRNELTDEYIDPFKVAAAMRELQAQLDAHIPAPAVAGSDEDTPDLGLTFTGWG